MATLATRLTSTGNLLVNGTFDEVSMPSGSLFFDGTNDYLRTPSDTVLNISSGNFTIEFFVYFNSVTAGRLLIGDYVASSTLFGVAIYITSSGILHYYLSSTGTTWNLANAVLVGNVATGTWYHVALVRNGSVFTPYLNGVAGTTTNTASSLTNNNFFVIGGDGTANSNAGLQGYLSNVRIIKGTALYTANFTPSIGVLESTANTSLLLNVLNSADYIKDNSPNNFSITRNGDTAFNSLTPFNRGAHSVSNNTVFTRLSDEVSLAAGSIFFDGTGDNLSVSNISSLSLGSGNFTIDFWINAPTQSGNACIIETRSAAGAAGYFVGLVNDNRIQFNYVTNYLSVGTIVPNAWNHVAIVRSGSTIRTFINGVAESGTFTSSATITANSASIGQKVYSVSTLINLTGYLSNLRVINGSALYSANFTPQQTILDSTSDTTYLLNVLNSTNALKDSSNNQNNTTAGGNAAWNAFGPFNQGVTGLAERRLSNATLVKDQYDEYTLVFGEIQYIGNTTSAIIPDSNTFSVDYPAGTRDGDLAIIAICGSNNFGSDFTATGWTKIDRQVVQTGVRSQLSYTIVSGTSSQAFTRTGITISSPSYILLVFRNANYSSYAFANNSTASPDSPSLTGTFNCVVSFGFTAATDTTVDPPTGYESANNVSNTSSLMSAYSISNQTNPDPGSFQNVTSGAWHAYTVGLVLK